MQLPKEILAIRSQADLLSHLTLNEEADATTMAIYLQVWLVYLTPPTQPALPAELLERMQQTRVRLLDLGTYLDALSRVQLRDQLRQAVAPLYF